MCSLTARYFFAPSQINLIYQSDHTRGRKLYVVSYRSINLLQSETECVSLLERARISEFGVNLCLCGLNRDSISRMAAVTPATTDYSNLFSIAGRTAFVTGASSGLGRAFAVFLAKQGANVVVGARRTEKLESLVTEINGLLATVSTPPPGKAKAVVLDVSADEPTVSAGIDEAAAAFGRIDIVVNNAGIFRGGYCLDISAADYDAVMNTNCRGVWMVAKLVGKKMAADGKGGNIINISSITGTHLPIRGESVYGMSKAAVYACTRALARELGPLNIRVNAIAPGVFPSEMTMDTINSESVTRDCTEKLPARRWGDTNVDLMGVLLLLASEKASRYIQGEVITVDGGHALVTPDLEDFTPGMYP